MVIGTKSDHRGCAGSSLPAPVKSVENSCNAMDYGFRLRGASRGSLIHVCWRMLSGTDRRLNRSGRRAWRMVMRWGVEPAHEFAVRRAGDGEVLVPFLEL